MVSSYTNRIKEDRRREWRPRGREKKEDDRNNNRLVLSLYSDKFSSCLGFAAPAGARTDDKPPLPRTMALAIYDQGIYKS